MIVREGLSAPEGWAIPADYLYQSLARCRGCGALMAWAQTPVGRMAPLDQDGTNHFVTCPEREQFRRKR